jgi:single-stranded-DNA-specific exonuclease
MQLAKIPLDRAPTAAEVGFRIAPRINAAGRMDIADDVVELFLTRNPVRARELAVKLDGLNQDRRDSEARALDAIDGELLTLVDADGMYPRECLILDHPEWHRGVLGILASRVVDRTGRPALVITHADGEAHGSGRSIAGFHLLEAISAADAADPEAPLFHRFGGHAHAVGFSLPCDRLALLRARMKSYSASRLTTSLLLPQRGYDAELTFADFTPELAGWTARCGPFGIGNPEPIFATRNAVIAAPIRLIQEKHLCLQLMGSGCTQTGSAIPALGWSRGPADWPALCAAHGLTQGSAVDVLYRIRKNSGPYAGPHFGGLELELCALEPAAQRGDGGLA